MHYIIAEYILGIGFLIFLTEGKKMKRLLKKMSTIILITAVFFTCAGTSFAAAFTYNSAVEKKLFSTANLEDYVKPQTPAFDKDKG